MANPPVKGQSADKNVAGVLGENSSGGMEFLGLPIVGLALKLKASAVTPSMRQARIMMLSWLLE